MVVFKNKHFKMRSDRPDDDFVGNADYVIPDGSELAQKIMEFYPNFDFVLNDDCTKIIDVVATEPQPEPEKPPEPPTNAELAAAIAELAEVICGG